MVNLNKGTVRKKVRDVGTDSSELSSDQSNTQAEAELLVAVTELTSKLEYAEEENKAHRVNMLDFSKKRTSLIEEIQNHKESTQTKVEKIIELESEVSVYETSMKNYEDNVTQLKKMVASRDAQLIEQQKKFDEAGNPDYENLVKLETTMAKHLYQIERNIKESLLKEVQENNSKLEEKMNRVITERPCYAENESENATDNSVIPSNTTPAQKPVDLRSIMREAENEKLAEESQKRTRACNIILHGVAESASTEQNLGKQHDEDFVVTFITALGLDIDYKAMYRLGKRDESKGQSKRPIKVIFRSDADKDRIMASLKNLKGRDDYKDIGVKEDFTIQDRNLIKQWVEKSNNANAQEPIGSKYEWKVRGTPKNGMFLKRFQKRIQTQQY